MERLGGDVVWATAGACEVRVTMTSGDVVGATAGACEVTVIITPGDAVGSVTERLLKV